jgi:hypothetical protein
MRAYSAPRLETLDVRETRLCVSAEVYAAAGPLAGVLGLEICGPGGGGIS